MICVEYFNLNKHITCEFFCKNHVVNYSPPTVVYLQSVLQYFAEVVAFYLHLAIIEVYASLQCDRPNLVVAIVGNSYFYS